MLVNVIFNLFIAFIFLIYFISITIYFFKNVNANRRKVNIYWLNLWFINFLFFVNPLVYVISLISQKGKEHDAFKLEYNVRLFYFILILCGLGNIFENFIKSFYLYFRKEISPSYAEDPKGFLLRDCNYSITKSYARNSLLKDKIFKKNIHFWIKIIIWTFNLILIYFYQTLSGLDDNFLLMISIIKISIFIFSFGISVINIKILQNKKNVFNLNYKCLRSKLEYIRYQKSNICYDFIIYKTILDVLLCLPFTILIILQKPNLPILIINYIAWLAYNLFFANILLLIDVYNKIETSNWINKIFFSKYFYIKIGKNIGFNVVYNSKLIKMISDDPKSNYTINSNITDSLNSSVSKEELIQIGGEKDFSMINFFIIFKLFSLYFRDNASSYEFYESKYKEIQEKEKIEFTSNNFDKFSKISKSINKSYFSKSIASNCKENINYEISSVFSSIEDEEMKDQFSSLYLLKNNNPEDFVIESLFNDHIFQLYPFYQVSVKDILSSLDMERNKHLFKIFYEKKYADRNFNHFYSKDTFLNFEIYDSKTYNILEEFIISYKDYLLKRITNWKQTFLPLIIGVFKIKYFDYNKIVVLYRHPLAFSPFLSFKYWININLKDFEEKISISSNSTEVVDIKEIEVKDNIMLHPEDFQEVKECFSSDLHFIKSLPYYTNTSFNIFIINEVRNFLSNVSNVKNDNFIDDSDSREFMTVLRKTEIFRDTAIKNLEKSKKEFGSDVTSPFDKIVTNYVVNTKYLIKIYFSDLFNICDKEENKNHSHANKLTIEEHNTYLINYIKEGFHSIIKCNQEAKEIENENNI